MANVKLVYPSGDPAPVEYTCTKNPDYNHRPGARLNLNNDKRTLDGTYRRYVGPRKQKYELTFSYVGTTQKDYFLDLWDFQCPIDLYLDGVNLDATVMMTECPDPESQSTNPMTWTFSVLLEEV